jgi:hypothetical protein
LSILIYLIPVFLPEPGRATQGVAFFGVDFLFQEKKAKKKQCACRVWM